MITILALGAALLLCVGILVGSSLMTQALGAEFRRLAVERRELNEQWMAIRAASTSTGAWGAEPIYSNFTDRSYR